MREFVVVAVIVAMGLASAELLLTISRATAGLPDHCPHCNRQMILTQRSWQCWHCGIEVSRR